MTLVSVVVPAYNAAATLAETLDSICAQDWHELEIVVVDDGSTDDTRAIAEHHARRDSRLRIVRQMNGGASRARNLGIRTSRGAYVAPCDADDIWHPERISRLMCRMRALGADTGFVYSLSRTIDAAGRVTGNVGVPGFEGSVYLRSLALNFVGNGSAALFRRVALDDVGGYEPRLRNCDDWHVQALIARRWKVGFLPQFLTGYRLADQGKSSDALRMKAAALTALAMIVEQYPETPDWVHASVGSARATRLGIEKLRRAMPLAAARDLAQGFRLAPRVALETLFFGEMPRLVAKLAQPSGGRRNATTGPAFRDVDPADVMGEVPHPVLRRLVDVLSLHEECFFAMGQAARPSTPARAGAPCRAEGTLLP